VIEGKVEKLLHLGSNGEKNQTWPQLSRTLDIIKRTNLRLHGVEEFPEIQTFNEIIAENFLNLEKDMDIQMQEVCRTADMTKKYQLLHVMLYLKFKTTEKRNSTKV
jgi:hypothetical protein